MYQRPGDFEYKKFEIKNYNGDTIQLSPSVVISLHIFESIFDPYIKAVAIINDTNSILESLPIIGQEEVSIMVKPIGLEEGQIDLKFIPYKISDRLIPGMAKNSTYTLSMYQKDTVLGMKKSFSSAYSGSISDIIKKLLKDTSLSPTKTRITETLNKHNILFPNTNLFESIAMLQNYAQSDLYKPSNFFFYQDHVNGYNFRPIAQMISETPLQQPSKEGQGASQNQKYYFTTDTAVSRLSDSSIFSMKGFESIKDLDNFYNLQAGMFGSNLISHDLVTKSWKRYTYDYQKEFSKENHLYKNKLIRNGTQIIDFDNSERVINHLLPTDSFRKDSKWVKDHKSTLDLDFGRHVEENYLSRKSYLLQMDYLKLNISVIGDMRVVPGTVIELEFPDTSSTDNKRKNEKYSGKYLVTTVRHGFSLTEPRHLMHLEVVKDSFEKELTVDKKVKG